MAKRIPETSRQIILCGKNATVLNTCAASPTCGPAPTPSAQTSDSARILPRLIPAGYVHRTGNDQNVTPDITIIISGKVHKDDADSVEGNVNVKNIEIVRAEKAQLINS